MIHFTTCLDHELRIPFDKLYTYPVPSRNLFDQIKELQIAYHATIVAEEEKNSMEKITTRISNEHTSLLAFTPLHAQRYGSNSD